MRSLRLNRQSTVNKRIMKILNRILILTILYEIPYFSWIFIKAAFSVSSSTWIIVIAITMYPLSQITILYSMFLMQKHNKSEYIKFLQFTYCIGTFHCLCCCFKLYVKNEIEMNVGIDGTKDIDSTNAVETDVTLQTETTIGTSVSVTPIEMNQTGNSENNTATSIT